MLDRRRFTFATLVALVSAPAAAHDGIPELQQEADRPPSPSLVPTFQLRRKGSELHVDLVLRNAGDRPVDVLVALGKRPGPSLFALVDGASLEEIVEVDRRAMMSRIGPMPQYAPLASGDTMPFGPFRFRYPATRPDAPVDLTVSVGLGDAYVELPPTRVVMARAGA